MKNFPVREGLWGISPTTSKPYLLGSRCPECQGYQFPKKRVCPVCFSNHMEEVSLSTRGRIYTYTINRQGSAGLYVPYATVYVDLPEDVRVFAQSDLSRWEHGTPVIGKEVELVIGPIGGDGHGNQIIGIQFNPVPGA